jgi:hypothetical protein
MEQAERAELVVLDCWPFFLNSFLFFAMWSAMELRRGGGGH